MWKNIGLVFAKLGGFALNAALWASAHPDVITAVSTAAGHPEIGAGLNTANAVVAAADAAVTAKK